MQKTSIEKQVKSKVISLKDKLDLIEREVRNKLSKQMNNVLCITSKEDFHAYIDKCIKKGRVAVDTETNNSLDPITWVRVPWAYILPVRNKYIFR